MASVFTLRVVSYHVLVEHRKFFASSTCRESDFVPSIFPRDAPSARSSVYALCIRRPGTAEPWCTLFLKSQTQAIRLHQEAWARPTANYLLLCLPPRDWPGLQGRRGWGGLMLGGGQAGNTWRRAQLKVQAPDDLGVTIKSQDLNRSWWRVLVSAW